MTVVGPDGTTIQVVTVAETSPQHITGRIPYDILNQKEWNSMKLDPFCDNAVAPELEDRVFDYLDVLRESGITNMFGAGPYVEEAFDLKRRVARDLVIKWMTTFEDRHPNA